MRSSTLSILAVVTNLRTECGYLSKPIIPHWEGLNRMGTFAGECSVPTPANYLYIRVTPDMQIILGWSTQGYRSPEFERGAALFNHDYPRTNGQSRANSTLSISCGIAQCIDEAMQH